MTTVTMQRVLREIRRYKGLLGRGKWSSFLSYCNKERKATTYSPYQIPKDEPFIMHSPYRPVDVPENTPFTQHVMEKFGQFSSRVAMVGFHEDRHNVHVPVSLFTGTCHHFLLDVLYCLSLTQNPVCKTCKNDKSLTEKVARACVVVCTGSCNNEISILFT